MKLEDIISQSIHENGKPIGFDVFMNFALYSPGLGYYRSSANIFGHQGDFITAPETSDLFGYSVAKQCAQIINGGDVLEFGAGSGVLAVQLLFELGRVKSLPKKYYIMELSGQLKQQQKQTILSVLPELIDRVEWLTELPIGFSGVVIANEVLDAIPAKRLIFSWCAKEINTSPKTPEYFVRDVWIMELPLKKIDSFCLDEPNSISTDNPTLKFSRIK